MAKTNIINGIFKKTPAKIEEEKQIMSSISIEDYTLTAMLADIDLRIAKAKEAGYADDQSAIINIPVKYMTIDPAYQSDIRTQRSKNYLLNNWNDCKLMPLICVLHREEGKVYIVDGYGRLIVSQRLNPEKYKELKIILILNAPTEPVARRKFEAELYAYQNRDVATLTPLQKHDALTCMEDYAVTIINDMKEKYHYEIIQSGPASRVVGHLKAYTTAKEIINNKTLGKDCFEYILQVCESNGFNKKSNGYSTYVFHAFRDIWKYYPENREETKAFLGEFLRKYDPEKLRSKALAKYDMLSSVRAAVSLYTEDLCVMNLDLKQKRKTEGTRVVPISA